ncbi:hypothetical protein KGF57_000686 [Candida theae]|uniref:RING-type domain-containing protein n=1 Tax=Candida theae TaxID=1198502 RepID=A0AAD5BIE7_9ASCO|nr:uncharacterized protein KGF57_000686 [Candida theae]KAI5966013.1 hypothetical protein KGF57_000686 [Candida theae]
MEEQDTSKARYNDTITITDYASSFNLIDNDSTPDLRNLKYKTNTDHLNCPICQQPFITPLTTICGHTFCKECILEFVKSLRNGTTSNDHAGHCPLDRTPIDPVNTNDLFPTPLIVTNLVDDLKVYCLNSERGCDWSGSRWEVDHHVTEQCPYTGVKCGGCRYDDSKYCELLVERRYLKDIEANECVHKLFKCEFCDSELTKIDENEHLEQECLYNFKTCELCGNDSIPQKNMAKHQDNCLKMGKVKCPAHEIGCRWVGSNETSLEIHLQNGNCQLNQFLPFYTSMNERMTSLESENEFLQRQLHKILDSIIQGKVTNLGYNEGLEEINKYSGEADQDKLIYLNFELDRLKFEINEKLIPFMNRSKISDQEKMIKNLVNDNFMMREDMNLQRMMINSLRKQLQFMLFSRNRGGVAAGLSGGLGNGTTMPGTLHSDDFATDLYELESRSSSEERFNLKL